MRAGRGDGRETSPCAAWPPRTPAMEPHETRASHNILCWPAPLVSDVETGYRPG